MHTFVPRSYWFSLFTLSRQSFRSFTHTISSKLTRIEAIPYLGRCRVRPHSFRQIAFMKSHQSLFVYFFLRTSAPLPCLKSCTCLMSGAARHLQDNCKCSPPVAIRHLSFPPSSPCLRLLRTAVMLEDATCVPPRFSTL